MPRRRPDSSFYGGPGESRDYFENTQPASPTIANTTNAADQLTQDVAL